MILFSGVPIWVLAGVFFLLVGAFGSAYGAYLACNDLRKGTTNTEGELATLRQKDEAGDYRGVITNFWMSVEGVSIQIDGALYARLNIHDRLSVDYYPS